MSVFNLILLQFTLPGLLWQDNDADQQSGERKATVKGRIIQHADKRFQIDFDEFAASFQQQVQLPMPPLPDQWSQMDQESRQQWFTQFEKSESGVAFLKRRQKLIADAARFEIKFESNGNYVLYDVPPGVYGLRGRTEQVIDGQDFVLEIFAQVEVTDGVDEVLLDPIAVLATRLVKTGNKVPTFTVPTFDGQATIDNQLIRQKNVLLHFWSMESPPSIEFGKTVQTAYQQLSAESNLQLLSICVASEKGKALEHVKEVPVRGWHGHADSWEHEIVEAFGVRGIPALFLVGDDGKILVTNQEFRQMFQNSPKPLAEIIKEVLGEKKS